MSLHDEHLKQALKNAPDRDLEPNDATRAAILAYANKAVKPRRASLQKRFSNWMNEWFGARWSSVGMGSAVATVLIVVVFWHEQPDDALWKAAAPNEKTAMSQSAVHADKQLAETSVAEPPKVDMPASASPAELPSQPKAKRHEVMSSREHVADALQGSLEMVGKADVGSQAAAPAPAPVVGDDIGTQNTNAGLASPAELSKPAAKREVAKKSASLAKPSDGAKSGKLQSQPMSAQVESGLFLESINREGGVLTARKDIQAGKLRLLAMEVLDTQDKDIAVCATSIVQSPNQDEQTGYGIQRILLCNPASVNLTNEVAAYNQAMRDWHAKQE